MPARVLVIGLDAAEATLLERFANEGRLTTLPRLINTGTRARLTNCLDTLPGAIWPEIVSGRPCGQAAQFFHPDQLRTGTARLHPLTARDIDPSEYYWSIASRAGRRVCVVDHVHTVRSPDLNGLQLIEWGNHDRNMGTDADPPELLAEVRGRFGTYPVHICDEYPDDRRGHHRLLADLRRALDMKSAAVQALLEREPWDLFSCVFTESHCVGHHFWHYRDPTHPDYEPDAPHELVDAIPAIYTRLDETVGRLIAAAGPDATVVVLASHGMGRPAAGWQLLAEVLVRLGLSSDGGSASASVVRRLQNKIRERIPKRWVRPLQVVADTAPVRALQSAMGGMVFPLQSPRTRAATLPNNRVGAIRLNLKGREPFGSVAPGAEADALMAEIRREIEALEDPTTGLRIVERTQTAAEAFGPDHHPDVPDLLVLFRTDLGPIEACRSPRVGLVQEPARVRRICRTGDHTPESRLWATGPGIAAGVELAEGSTLSVAPSVLALLGIERAPWHEAPPLPLRTGG